MAGIDKIYGNKAQYKEFRKWLKRNKPEAVNYLYPPWPKERSIAKEDMPISNFPKNIDMWLFENCPIKFVTDRIKEQYQSILGEK